MFLTVGPSPAMVAVIQIGIFIQVFLPRPQDIYSRVCGDTNRNFQPNHVVAFVLKLHQSIGNIDMSREEEINTTVYSIDLCQWCQITAWGQDTDVMEDFSTSAQKLQQAGGIEDLQFI